MPRRSGGVFFPEIANLKLNIVVDARQSAATRQMLRNYTTAVSATLLDVLDAEGTRLMQRISAAAPVASGYLSESLRYRVLSRQKTMEVYSTAPYSRFVEFGTSRHTSGKLPPFRKIRDWAIAVGAISDLTPQERQRIAGRVKRARRAAALREAETRRKQEIFLFVRALQRKIAREGVRSQPFFVPVWRAERDRIKRRIRNALRRLHYEFDRNPTAATLSIRDTPLPQSVFRRTRR